MRAMILSLLTLALLFSAKPKEAEAGVVVGPGPYVGVTAQWGYIPWYGVWNPYGYSYWGYYRYQPRYATYGAIAYDLKTDAAGWSYGVNTRWGAQRSARAFCGDDCRSVLWVQGGCGAISLHATVTKDEEGKVVSTKVNGLTWGLHPNKYGAKQRAQRACRRQGPGLCKVRAWVCSY